MTNPHSSFPFFFGMPDRPSPGGKQVERAFSLMELLVAVGIVSVLAALLFPTIAKMKEAGQSAQCIGNLRALGQFGISYSVDHNGNMPQAYVGGPNPYGPPASAAYWFDTYAAYLGYVDGPGVNLRSNLPAALTCASNKKTSAGGWGGRNRGRMWAINWGTGYSGTPSDWNNPEPHEWVKYGQIKRYSSNEIVPLETLSKTAWFVDGAGFDFLYDSAIRQDFFKRPHNGKSNVLYFDGHAATVDIPDFTKMPSSVWRQQVWVDFFGNK